MDRAAVFNHYSHMLDTLLENTLFFNYYFQAPYTLEEDIEHPCFDLDWYIHFGATRFCLEDRAYDYVVKGNLLDYCACEKEQEIFEVAEKEGLSKYFVQPHYIGTYTRTINFYDSADIEPYMDDFCSYDEEEFIHAFEDNEDRFGEIQPILISIPLYAYQRVVPYNFNKAYDLLAYQEKSDLEKTARKIKSPLRERNLAIAIEFVREYGEEEYSRFSDFLREWRVNDLHCNNLCDIEGRLCLSDFAGYDGDYDDDWEF